MTVPAPTAPPTVVSMTTTVHHLTYRLASLKDHDLLRQFRVECGWGLPKLEKKLHDPDWVFCVFVLEEDDGVESGRGSQDVGMGAWVLDRPEDPETASRAEGIVYLSSLFIRPKYQASGLGTSAMDLLERIAIETYGAKAITLDTTAHHCDWVEDDLRGRWTKEDFKRPGKSVGWYKRRGYEQYRPTAPTFPHPTPDDPDRKLTAIFMKKQA